MVENALINQAHNLMSFPTGWKTGFLQSPSGGSLRYGIYCTSDSFDRVIFFLNGRTEFIEKYSYLPKDLNLEKGVAFITMDHKGQGLSSGQRSHVNHYDEYLHDAKYVLETLAGGKPYDLLAHSMGGLIALYGTKKGHFNPNQIILSAPFLEFPNEPFPRFLVKPLSYFFCSLGLRKVHFGVSHTPAFAINPLTGDVLRYERLLASPFFDPGVSFAWVKASFEAIRFVQESNSSLPPTLILTPKTDGVVDVSGVFRLAYNHQGQVAVEWIEDAKHELFSEGPQIYDFVINTIKQRLNTPT